MMTYNPISKLNLAKDYILPCYEGQLKQLQKYLSIEKPDFDAAFSTYHMLYGPKGNRIYLLGLGTKKDSKKIDQAFLKVAFDNRKYWKSGIQVNVETLSADEVTKAAIGLAMADYQIGQYKSEATKTTGLNIEFASSVNIAKAVEEGMLVGQTINRIKTLVDAPANHKTPEFLGAWALSSAKQSQYECTVFHKEELIKQNFDAVMAVGKGSVHPPVVITTKYLPRPKEAIDIGLVGKGITFDTGGLSIKPSQNLHYMKSDMGGAAVVLGVVELAAKLKLNCNIVGVVASAENAVDSTSYRPGDVINSYSGKTIEIIDTDAEGRLVMADALSYIIKTYEPKQLIDLATLTGSVVRTLGNAAAGMFTNNQKMADAMHNMGEQTHERVWRLPLYEDFETDLHSDIADIRNFSGKPVAGAINAAKFLQAFTKDHDHWMHLDIAGVAFGDSPYSKMKSASGFGIQLILNYIKGLK